MHRSTAFSLPMRESRDNRTGQAADFMKKRVMQGEQQQQQERSEGRSFLCFRSLKRSATFGEKSCSFWRQIPFWTRAKGRRRRDNKVQTLMKYLCDLPASFWSVWPVKSSTTFTFGFGKFLMF